MRAKASERVRERKGVASWNKNTVIVVSEKWKIWMKRKTRWSRKSHPKQTTSTVMNEHISPATHLEPFVSILLLWKAHLVCTTQAFLQAAMDYGLCLLSSSSLWPRRHTVSTTRTTTHQMITYVLYSRPCLSCMQNISVPRMMMMIMRVEGKMLW